MKQQWKFRFAILTFLAILLFFAHLVITSCSEEANAFTPSKRPIIATGNADNVTCVLTAGSANCDFGSNITTPINTTYGDALEVKDNGGNVLVGFIKSQSGNITIVTSTPLGSTYNWGLKSSTFANGTVKWRILSSSTYGKIMSSNTTYTSDCSSGVDGFTVNNGAVAGNIDSIGGQDNNLRYTIANTNTTHYPVKSAVMTLGKRYQVIFSYYIPSGQSKIDSIYLYTGFWGELPAEYLTTTDSWTTVIKTFTCLNPALRFYAGSNGTYSFQDSGGDDVFYIRGITITELNSQIGVTSGTLHLATVDGGAMVFHDTIDLSGYKGDDVSSTPYLLVFQDVNGYTASAYGGADGSFESLDTEMIQDTGFDDPAKWTTETGWVVGSGVATATAAASGQAVKQNTANKVIGTMYKETIDVVRTSGSLGTSPVYNTGSKLITLTGSYSIYATARETYARVEAYATGDTFSGTVDNVSVKKVLDVPTTGLHLHSTKNGTDRKMRHVDASFNPNTVTKITVYRAY